MATIVLVSGVIGWDVTGADIAASLEDAGGDDLEIHISSLGGSVFVGTQIFNLLRAYKTQYPNAQIAITITGVAASMGSYLAASDVAYLVRAYDNTAALYHNPWSFAAGDYRTMRREADFLEGLAGMMGSTYLKRSGKSAAEVATLMNDETWLLGEQLKEHGFVDEILPADDADQETEPAAALAQAKLQFREMIAQAKARGFKEDPAMVAALIRDVRLSAGARNRNQVYAMSGTTPQANQNQKETTLMTPEEFKAKHPEVYDQVFAAGRTAGLAEGKKAGTDAERDRVTMLLAMKKDRRFAKIPAVQEALDDSVAQGKDKSEAIALVNAALVSGMVQAEADSPGAIDTGSADTATGETETNPEHVDNDPITEM